LVIFITKYGVISARDSANTASIKKQEQLHHLPGVIRTALPASRNRNSSSICQELKELLCQHQDTGTAPASARSCKKSHCYIQDTGTVPPSDRSYKNSPYQHQDTGTSPPSARSYRIVPASIKYRNSSTIARGYNNSPCQHQDTGTAPPSASKNSSTIARSYNNSPCQH
jgi:hypothetical protein